MFQSLKFFIALLFFSPSVFSQKYNFVNFTVEDGLIQSQAMHIIQDKNKYLWVGTEGGLCKFDGKTFVKYSTQDGLVSNFINKLMCDADGKIWIASMKGVSVFDGRGFSHVKQNNKLIGNTNYLSEYKGKVYAINNLKGCIIDKELNFKRISISNDTTERVTTIYRTPQNHLLAYVYSKGIYSLHQNGWKLLSGVPETFKDIVVKSILINVDSDTLIATNKGLFTLKKNVLDYYRLKDNSVINQVVFCLEQLNSAIWFGADQGAYKIENGNLIHFNGRNGLTDNFVYSIFKDAENNLWFASDADGIFKYKENNFSFYDKSFGLVNPIIMGVAQTTDGNIYAADYSGNLYRITDENKIEPLQLQGSGLNNAKINVIYADNENNLFIGTLGKQVFSYNIKTGVKAIGENSEYKLRGGNCFLKDSKGNLILGNAQGLFVIDKQNKIKKINTPPASFNALALMNDKRILVASSNGVIILDENYEAFYPKIKGVENSEILCLKYRDDIAWLGSTEHGVYRWDIKKNTTSHYDMQAGLPSNFIYSIIVRNDNDIWFGTGFGISNLLIDNTGKNVAVKNYSRADGLIGMECNHTSELLAADSTLWFGTTKGLAHFKPLSVKSEVIKPFVVLRSVKLFSAPVTDSSLSERFSSWYNIPEGLVLSSKQNNLTFELSGIYLSNPDDILYKYKLGGIDKDYTISNNPIINYPALPPGKYKLMVYAITKGGVESSNMVEYAFEIKKAFYQEAWFILLVFILSIGSIGLVIYLYFRKKQKEKLMREKIREEEFTKLRQRTAEDFHDEMGNKLTRISVLSDILKSKVNNGEQEVLNIVTQIKENTTALYNGSRDIIWSLNSKNDNFYEITEHVKNLGHEIFSETSTSFYFDHNVKPADNIKLKLDYSRNLIMIFKEVYNNILKHSQANNVNARVQLVNDEEALIMISDNGKGFDAKREHKGNGLKNMQNRIRRINGTLSINSSENNGTEILISLRDIFYI